MKNQEVDLYILGAGVSTPAHLTLEVLDALKKCKVLYTVIRQPKEEWLPVSVDIEVISYWKLFKSGDFRTNNYNLAVETILSAVKTQKPVAYLTPGNPVVFDSVSHALIQQGRERGYKVVVCAGISSIDTLLVDLVQDVTPGLQVYDASSVVLYDINLNPCFPVILFQVDVFGSNRALHGINLPLDYLVPLKNHLLKFYPGNHEVVFVRSQTSKDTDGRMNKMKIKDLDNVDSREEMGTSLFIPTSEILQTKSKDFL